MQNALVGVNPDYLVYNFHQNNDFEKSDWDGEYPLKFIISGTDFEPRSASVTYFISGDSYSTDSWNDESIIRLIDLGNNKYRIEYDNLFLYKGGDSNSDKKILTGSFEGVFDDVKMSE